VVGLAGRCGNWLHGVLLVEGVVSPRKPPGVARCEQTQATKIHLYSPEKLGIVISARLFGQRRPAGGTPLCFAGRPQAYAAAVGEAAGEL